MPPLRFAGFMLALSVCLCAQDDAPQTRRPFNRLIEDDAGGRVEVMVATYRKGDAVLTLHGAVHVADAEHYAQLQRRFEAFDALLYELIAEPDLRPYPGMPIDDESWISTVQGGIGQGLGLAAQFDCIDYRKDNFVHADMTDEQWYEALEAVGKSEVGELLSGGVAEPDREAEAKLRPIDLVTAFRSGGGIAELRIVAARMLTEPDPQRDQPTVIIEGRNECCLEVLQQQLALGKKKLGIYYGAAHMEHLERRLVEDFGWRRTAEEWLQAWDCRFARFPKTEKGLRRKRYRARKDLEVLVAAVDRWCREHREERVTWAKLRRAAADGKLPGRADGKDPWGRDYVLREVGGRCEVRCLGSDGKLDTDDDLAETGVPRPRK